MFKIIAWISSILHVNRNKIIIMSRITEMNACLKVRIWNLNTCLKNNDK